MGARLSFTASDGLEIAYDVDDFSDPWKQRPTLLLLHAAMGNARRLYRWVPILARHFRVVRPDLRGHGASGIPGPDQLTLERLVRDVLELADHVGAPRFHLAGSSAGAIVSMQVAMDHPGRVLSVGNFAAMPGLKHSLVDPDQWIAKIQARGLRGFLEDTIADRFPADADPGFVRWFIEESARNDAGLLARFVRLMKSVDQVDRLHEIRCPMLAVVPEHDPLATMAHYEPIRDRVPDCRFVVYRDLPHNITDAVPERCAEELRDFLLSRG
jgi:3-oxoadipate enol-lactonase